MFSENISTEITLFFMLFGVTGVVPLIAALYLLLRRGNAFTPEVTPPARLRRWAVSFFAVSALGHVWWLLFYIFSGGLNSVDVMLRSAVYVSIVTLDCVTMMTTIAGTLLAMLQDRRRSVLPVFVAMVPFVLLSGVLIAYPNHQFMLIASIYVILLYVVFAVYMVFAVKQYGRWLRDNYVDMERKEVWQTHVVVFFFMLLFLLYTFVDTDSIILIYILHVFQLVLYVLLLWRVETLTCLSPCECSQGGNYTEEASTPFYTRRGTQGEPLNLGKIERLLAEHCVDTQLYLQHDLSLQQLAQTIGTNRSYLSQYFSRLGITYNTYINNLRINHFISHYQKAAKTGKPIVAQQLASESGYRSYSTFSLAFKQRMGQSVTAWMRVSK